MRAFLFLLRALAAVIAVLISRLGAQAQIVYSCNHKSEAEIKVYVSRYKSEADLVVYRCRYRGEAEGNRGLWYFASYKSEAKKRVYITDYKSEADLIVCFTEYRSDAGWRNRSKMHLMY